MKYVNYINKITKALENYKATIDEYAVMYRSETAKLQQEIETMQGTHLPEYIEQYKERWRPRADYKALMDAARAKAEPTVTHYLACLERQVRGYFGAPVRSDFANKIMSIQITGLQLSDAEFEILKSTANSYMEFRLLNQIAMSRTEKAQKFTEQGSEMVDVSAPYLQMELPDIDTIMRAFKDYSWKARFMLSDYCAGGDLYGFLDTQNDDFVSVSADNYFISNEPNKMADVFRKANAILPESRVKTELTEADKRFIDTLVDPKYPSLGEYTVKGLAAYDPEIAELLRLDDRYKKYLPKEDEE